MEIKEKTKERVACILGIEEKLLFDNFYCALSEKAEEKESFGKWNTIHKENLNLNSESGFYLVWGHPIFIFKFLKQERRFDTKLFKVLKKNIKIIKPVQPGLFKVKARKIRKIDRLKARKDKELQEKILKKILFNSKNIKIKMAITLIKKPQKILGLFF